MTKEKTTLQLADELTVIKLKEFSQYIDDTYEQTWEEGKKELTTVELLEFWLANK